MSNIDWFWTMNSVILMEQDREIIEFMKPKLPPEYHNFVMIVRQPHDIHLSNYVELMSEFYEKERALIIAYRNLTVRLIVFVMDLL